jgi:hypothetical protein
MAVQVTDLLKMTQPQLDALFTGGAPKPVPNGPAKGTAIIAPGTTFSPAIAQFISVFAWEGKVFDATRGLLTNRLPLLGVNAIIAEISTAPSWFDGKPCLVLDYSKTSIVAHWIRDEIRRIGPKLYLGKVYRKKKQLIDFALETK